MTYLIIALTAIVSYLIGSVNFSILLSKMLSGKDIRESGSGNAGATNMLRTYGKKMGIITLLLDVLKGIVVILLSRLVKNIAGTDEIYPVISYIAGVCVILGHNFPTFQSSINTTPSEVATPLPPIKFIVREKNEKKM